MLPAHCQQMIFPLHQFLVISSAGISHPAWQGWPREEVYPFVRMDAIHYKAATKDLAEQRLNDLDSMWGKKYPIVIKS